MSERTWDYGVVECVRVVDGDTVDLRIDLGFYLTAALRFRLLGVDTPERGQPGWAEATDFARQWIAARTTLRVQTHKSDSFGRWLGDLYSGDEHLHRALIDAGHGVSYR